MRSIRLILPSVLLTLTVLVFAGCDGGGGGSAPAATQTDTYHFYAGSLHAVDAANPANPLVVDSEAQDDDTVIVHGTIDNATGTVTDLHARTVVYAKGGKLYKVSALKGATPTPVQLSSADDVRYIDTTAPDIANHNNAQVVYYGASDDSYKMVRVGMGTTDAPVPAKETLAPLYNRTGAIIGWLAFDYINNVDVVRRYDPNFQSGKDVIAFTDGIAFVESTIDDIFLEVDNDLYAYHVATEELRKLTTTATGIRYYYYTVKDGEYLYVSDGGDNILRVSLTNPTAAEVFVPTADTWAAPLGFTDTKLVYYQGGKLMAKPKAGGEPLLLASGVDFWGAKGTTVYYEAWKDGIPTAVAVRDDGTVLSETASARWVGEASSNTFDPWVSTTPQYLIMATGWKDDGTGFAGGTLQSFDTATNGLVATLGTIPADIRIIWVYGQIGGDVLGSAWDTNDNDIFFMNLKTPNSLIRVSNTPAVDEWPLFEFGSGDQRS